jgi:hypothetical protein
MREALTTQLQYWRQRLQWVEEQRAYWLKKGIGFFLLKIIDHAQVHIKTEVGWLEEFLSQLSEGLISEVKTSGPTGSLELSEASGRLSTGSELGEASRQQTQLDGHPKDKAQGTNLALTNK